MRTTVTTLLGAVAAGFEGDADEAVAAFAEDASFQDAPGEPVLTGREAILEHFMAYGGRRERFVRGRVLVDGDTVAVEYGVAFRADAHAYAQRGVAVLVVHDGQIADWKGVWAETDEDLSSWGEQQ